MNQPAVFGDHRLLTTTAGVRRRLQPDMSSNVQSPREICTDGVREEGLGSTDMGGRCYKRLWLRRADFHYTHTAYYALRYGAWAD